MASGQEPAAMQSPHQVTSEGDRLEVRIQRHTERADGARPDYGTLTGREYGLLVPEDPAGDPAVAGP